MIEKIKNEIQHFKSQSKNFKILVLTNLIYALVMPVIDIFVSAYIMRNSNDPTKVVIYQLTIYTGIPLTFLLNGFLLKHFNIRKLYSAGMMLSGVSMIVMMTLKSIDLTGIAMAGLIMGMSFGLYWSNRDFLALSITNDENRNYYYGLETFFYTVIAIAIPATIGWFIQSYDGDEGKQRAYFIITGIVFVITILASIVCFRGNFTNPTQKKFVYFKFHPLWNRLLSLATLKGLAQGFLVTAPSMLIFKLLGEEGALGNAQSIGAILAAIIIYFIGRFSKPSDRLKIFSIGLLLFAIGGIINGIFYNKIGVVIFLLLLLIAKPLMDLAYYPIQLRVIDIVSKIEKRGEFSYILNHEAGLYIGRLLGAGTFLALAYGISTDVALRYAIGIIGVVQLLSIVVAKPLMDLAYYPIQLRVIDIVSKIEKRGEFSYILNHEAGLYIGRLLGAGTFLALAYGISTDVALRYAIGIIGVVQLLSIVVAKGIISKGNILSKDTEDTFQQELEKTAENLV